MIVKVAYRGGRVHRVAYEGVTACGVWFRRPFCSVSARWIPLNRNAAVTCERCRRAVGKVGDELARISPPRVKKLEDALRRLVNVVARVGGGSLKWGEVEAALKAAKRALKGKP